MAALGHQQSFVKGSFQTSAADQSMLDALRQSPSLST